MADFSDVIKQLQDNKEQNRKSISNVNKNIAYQNAQMREVIESNKIVAQQVKDSADESDKKAKEESEKAKGFLGKIQQSIVDGTKKAEKSAKAAYFQARRDKGLEDSKGTEDKREQSRTFQKLIETVKGVKEGILKFGSSLKDKAKEFSGSTLGKVLIGAGLAALLWFMQSPYWEKTITLVKEYLVPALKGIYDAIGPFGMALAGMAFYFRGPLMKVIKYAGKVLNILRFRIMASYVGGWLGHIKDMMKNLGGRIMKGLRAVVDAAKAFKVFMMTDFIPRMWSSLKEMMRNLGGKIMTAIRYVVNMAKVFKVFMLTSFIPGLMSFMTGMLTSLSAMLVPLLPFIAIGAAIVAGLYALYESFSYAKGIFDETGSIGQAIAAFAIHLVTAPLRWIKDLGAWILGLFGFDEEAEALKNFDITKTLLDGITTMLNKVVAWFKLLFTDPVAAMSALWTGLMQGYDGLMGLLFSPINKAINWVMEKFGWKTEGEEDFDLWQFIKNKMSELWGWITGMFDFSIDANAIKEYLPSWTPDWMLRSLGIPTSGGGDGEEDYLQTAQDSGVYDKDMIGNSEIDRAKVPMASTRQLEAIIADDDLAPADKQFIMDELAMRERVRAMSQGANGSQIDEQSRQYVTGSGQPIVITTTGHGGGPANTQRRDTAPQRVMPVNTANGDQTTAAMVSAGVF